MYYICYGLPLLHSIPSVCEYGDRVLGCSASDCAHIFEDGTRNDLDCCGTCGVTNITCHDVKQIDHVTCDVRIGRDGVQACYNTTVAYWCCDTCAALRRPEARQGEGRTGFSSLPRTIVQ